MPEVAPGLNGATLNVKGQMICRRGTLAIFLRADTGVIQACRISDHATIAATGPTLNLTTECGYSLLPQNTHNNADGYAFYTPVNTPTRMSYSNVFVLLIPVDDGAGAAGTTRLASFVVDEDTLEISHVGTRNFATDITNPIFGIDTGKIVVLTTLSASLYSQPPTSVYSLTVDTDGVLSSPVHQGDWPDGYIPMPNAFQQFSMTIQLGDTEALMGLRVLNYYDAVHDVYVNPDATFAIGAVVIDTENPSAFNVVTFTNHIDGDPDLDPFTGFIGFHNATSGYSETEALMVAEYYTADPDDFGAAVMRLTRSGLGSYEFTWGEKGMVTAQQALMGNTISLDDGTVIWFGYDTIAAEYHVIYDVFGARISFRAPGGDDQSYPSQWDATHFLVYGGTFDNSAIYSLQSGSGVGLMAAEVEAPRMLGGGSTTTVIPFSDSDGLTEFCEDFEGGADGDAVSTSNTAFRAVNDSVTFTTDSFGGTLAATSSDGSGYLTVFDPDRTSGIFDSVVVVEGKLKLASGGSAESMIYLLQTAIAEAADLTNGCLNCGPALFLYTDGSLPGSHNIRLQWYAGSAPSFSGPVNHEDFTLAYDTWYHVTLTWDDSTSQFSLVVKTGDDATTVYSRVDEPGPTGSVYFNSTFDFAWNGSTTTWDEIGANCTAFVTPPPEPTNNAHCGTKVAKYTVTTNTGLPYTVSPNGPNNPTHHGQFAIAPTRTASFMASLASDNDQDFYVQPIARFLTWNGTTFTLLSNAVMGPAVHMTGDQTWSTITRLIDAPSGATHWGLDFAVQDNLSGTIAPTIGTVLYLDCVYVVEDGRDLASEPYLDGDQTGTSRGDGYWEGTAHDATSIWGAPTPPDDTNPPPDDPGGDDGGQDADPDPNDEEPTTGDPIPPPPPPVVVLDEAAELVTRKHPGKTFCLDADVQLGDQLFNQIDEFGTLWVVTDVDGWWNLPDPDIPDITRGIDDGSYQTRGRYSARVFTLSGSFWPATPADVRMSRDRLIRAANLCHYGAWFATHEADATRASQVWLSGRPSIATVSDNGRTDFSIGLKAPDPVKYGLYNRVLPGWNSAALKSASSMADFGRVYDRVYPWAYPTVPSGGVLASTATVSNDGNVRVSPIITVYGPTAGPINIHNITTSQTTRVRLGLASDDVLLIDCQNRTVSLNGVPNKRLYLDTITDWIYLDPGPNKFNYTEESGSSSSFITVQWRSGWIG